MFVQVTVRETPCHPQTTDLSSLLSAMRKAALKHDLKLSLFSMADKFYFVPTMYRRHTIFFLLETIFLSVRYLCYHSFRCEAKCSDFPSRTYLLYFWKLLLFPGVSHLVCYFLGQQHLKIECFLSYSGLLIQLLLEYTLDPKECRL